MVVPEGNDDIQCNHTLCEMLNVLGKIICFICRSVGEYACA